MTTRRSQPWLGGLALAGILVFALACILAQCLRHDLDWIDVPLSFYLLGPGGAWLRAAYFVMAASLAMLGIGLYRSLSAQARSAAPLLLFIVSAVALCITAVAETNTWAHPATFHGFIHGVAAQTTFLCITMAMLLQSARMRLDARWKPRFKPALIGATVCFAALWVQALWRDLPRGLSQKVLVLLILTWLAMATFEVWRGSRKCPTWEMSDNRMQRQAS
ncbi:MAG TPA: DUF998 domain-containing protein [Rhodanobacteraceae bacterium]|nr:DUF998 domain-containing protein [Rhodanobacteraceae bacterium]